MLIHVDSIIAVLTACWLELFAAAGTLLTTALEAALHIPQQLPTSKLLRARFISFLHRMVRSCSYKLNLANANMSSNGQVAVPASSPSQNAIASSNDQLAVGCHVLNFKFQMTISFEVLLQSAVQLL